MDSQVVGGFPSMTQVGSSTQLGSLEGKELGPLEGSEEGEFDGISLGASIM